jgi:putative transposase
MFKNSICPCDNYSFSPQIIIMPHSYYKLWIHAVWATKERASLIHAPIENKIYDYMRKQYVSFGCPVRIINGMPDHVHSLFLANASKPLNEVFHQVKGSTSHWVNDQNLIKEKFTWQTGLAAFSVSESVLEKVYLYILNQKKHHRKKSFQEEYEELIQLHKIEFKNF